MSLLASSSVSVINVNDGATGAQGPQGISVTKVVEEYRLSNSKTELTGSGTGYTWSETKPSIPAGKYLWIRERTDLSNNQSSYGSAHCDIVTSGLVQDVDRNSGVITSKVWESYTSSYVNEYDGTTGKAIRDRVSKTETDINGITSRVSDVESETDDLGTRMTSAESSITQNANNIELKVSKDGVISSINQSAETVKIEASKVDIEGAVTFSSFDSALQNRLTTAESDASTAKSNASSAVSTANTASSNASSALSKVNASIKSTTMHYLATSASSGVTTSTSGWTTSIQTITTSKPYLWTYQTVTKVDNTTYNTDPVISGVYGNTGGKGDTGVGVSKVEQLYRTSNSTTAPAAPTSKVTSTSTAANTWTLAMPTYSASYPYYYICTQTTYDNGTVKWTSVSRSSALEDANKTAATANTNASAAVSTANTANTNASTAVSTANTAKSTADTAKSTADAAKSKADSAASLLSTWTGDATLATTTINGGYIKTHTIESTHLATDAIMSSNYQASSDASSPYSATGAFLDLSTGNLYMPNFGVNGTTGAAYFNGTVNANAGKFGDDSSYWNIETVYDYDMQPHAALVGTGSPYLQTGNWQVSDNAVATRKYTSTSDSSGKATYYKDSGTNTFYDVGMKIPSNFSAYSASDSSVTKYNKAFYYGRKYTGNNAPSLDSDWTYFFSIDSGGNVITAGDVYEGGVKLSDKYAAITDVGSAYLPKTGGTITGNLTVNGSFTTNLQLQTNLGSTSSAQLTGAANAVVKPGVTGTLGVGNGGTGQTTAQNAANAFINALSTGSTTSMLRDADYFISQYIGGGTSNTKYYRRPISTIWDYIEDKIETTYDITNTYRRLDDNDFDTINVTDLTAGNLIVNGAARFTNDVFADTFTGNLVGTASNAVEFSSNQSVSLTGDTTGSASSKAGWSVTTTTNKLTYQPQLTTQAAIDGFIEASKYMVATFKTTDANNIGMASNDGMIMSLAWSTTAYGAQIALDDITAGVLKIRGRANSVWGDWRTVIHDGNYTNYTVTKAGTGASGTWGISISGNAATATKLATARTITLSGSVTGSTTFDGSGNVTIATTTNHTHNYAGSSSAGGSANTVAGEAGSVDAARHVWFSDSSTETKRNYDDDFKYNPSTNVLTVGSITGNAATATKVNKSLKMANNKSFDGSADVNLFTNDLIPAISKTYTSTAYYSTDNSWDNSSWYFMSVKPDSWYKTWRVKFKIRSYCPSYTNVDSTSWVEVYGRANSPTSYKIYNEFYDRAHYYVNVYPLTATGFNAGYGHAIGISIRYATNYTNSAYYRTFEVDYFNSDGCTVTVLDTPVKWGSWSGTGTTNYGGINNFDAVNRGLRETGDDNNYEMLQMSTNYMYNGNTMRMPGYTLMGIDRSGNAQAISLYSANYESTTVSINTARVYNTAGFDWTQGIYYLTSGTNFAKSAVLQTSLRLAYAAMDFRYTDNNVASSTANNLGMVSYKPVYFRGVIKNDGLFYLAPISVTYDNKTYQRAWTQDIPTSVETDGTYQYVYWFLGYPYYNSSYANSQYQLNLFSENKMYWYHNNRFEEYVQESAYSDRANHANVTSTANAVAYYTDTKGTFGSKASANGALYATSTNGALQWGTLPVAQGGTGLTSSPSILVNLASTSATNVMAASPRPGVTGTLPIANGGTGATTADGIKTNLSLNNVTNNKQVKGLASGTTSGHLVSWGSDGYTVADSGLTATSVATKITLAGSDYSASSNTITITQANLQSAVQSTGILLMTSAERSKLASIQVSEGGTIDFSGVTASTPLTATVGTNKTVNITHNTSGVTAGTYRSVTVNTYGHVTAGTNPTTLSGYGITDAKIASGVITLGSNTITPLTASSTLDATKLSGTASISTTGNATTATKFASAQSVTLTGDTTGTASSQAGWSVATTTTRLSTVGDKRSEETTPNSYANKLIFQGLKGKSTIGSPSNDTYSYLIGLRGWSDSSGGKAHELAFNDSGINHRSGSTTTWDAWEKLVTSANYTDYTVTKTGTGASGTWGISISGNASTANSATTATKFTTPRTISLSGAITGSTTFDGSNNVTITTKPTNEYSIPGGKGVRIQYPSSAPVLISCQKMNASGRLILIGGGYGAGGTIRNDFTELVSPSADRFTWSILDSDDIGTSIEIMNNNNGDATLYIYTISSCTITEITQLTTAAQNRVLLNSSNYNSYSPTLTGTGASGTWGINISGNATTASKANITTTTNAIAKYSDTQGTFANSNVCIDSDGNVVIGSTDSSGNVSGAGNFKIGVKNDNYGIMPWGNNWNQIGSGSLYWFRGYINHYYGQTSHVTNWDAGKNIGTAATASAAATRGSVYFYNTCAANGTQTKTLLDANASTSSNITITLPSSTGTLALTSSSITGNAATATKWASAQTVYVALGTASKTTSIQGGSSSAVTLGVDGVLGVANGGTGASSFTANSVIMSGSSTTGAFTTRSVTNNTSASAVTANTNLITANTLAYWTGSSNLTTCSKGTFGTAATYSATTSVTSGSGALVTSGGVSTALGSYVTLSTTQTISGTKTFSAATSFTNTTASTSKSTGAVKVSGGLGVAGQVSANTAMIGDAVSLVYDSSISALCFQFA